MKRGVDIMKKGIFVLFLFSVLILAGCAQISLSEEREQLVQIDNGVVKLQDNIATGDGLDTVYDDRDSNIFLDDEIIIGNTHYDFYTVLQLSSTENLFDMETSLTSHDDKYDWIPRLEIKKDSLKYCYMFGEDINLGEVISEDSPLYMDFLEKTIRINRIDSEDEFTLQLGDSYGGGVGDIINAHRLSMEILAIDLDRVIVRFDGTDQRTIMLEDTITINEIEVHLDDIIFGGNTTCGFASFVIGPIAMRTYQDGDRYIDYCSPENGHGDPSCDENNPDWIWDIKNLTSLVDHDSNAICIENDFEAYNFNKDPVGVGEYYGLPYGFVYVGVDSLTVSDEDYMWINIITSEENIENLSNVAWAPSSAIVLTIKADEMGGLIIDQSSISENGDTPLTMDKKTDKILLWMNATYAGIDGEFDNLTHIFYEDSDNQIQYAGNVSVFNNISTAQTQFGHVNYGKTNGTDMNITLFGNTSNDDSLFLGFMPNPALSSRDNLWFRINTDVDKPGDGIFEGFGDTDNDEADEVIWGSTTYPSLTSNTTDNFNSHIGSKQYGLRTGYGVKIVETDAGGDKNNFVLGIPISQVKANVALYGGKLLTVSRY